MIYVEIEVVARTIHDTQLSDAELFDVPSKFVDKRVPEAGY